MYKFLLLTLLLMLSSACAPMGNCSCAAPSLGIITDEMYTVTVVKDYFPAEYAGVQIGDKLVDLRPAKPEPGFSMNPVPFTDEDRIHELVWYRVPSFVPPPCCGGPRLPLVLRVERDGQIIELPIQSDLTHPRPTPTAQEVSPIATPTPIPTRTPMPSEWLDF